MADFDVDFDITTAAAPIPIRVCVIEGIGISVYCELCTIPALATLADESAKELGDTLLRMMGHARDCVDRYPNRYQLWVKNVMREFYNRRGDGKE